MGGGGNHRRNLADGILIKDNHIEAMRLQASASATPFAVLSPVRRTPSR